MRGALSPNVSVGDGNPSLHHCMGPRIREDDKIVSPSSPRVFLFNTRGAFGVGGNPVLSLSVRLARNRPRNMKCVPMIHVLSAFHLL